MVLRPFKNSTRVINNATAKAVNALEQEKGSAIEFGDVMELMAGTRGRQAEQDDDPEAGILTAGQVIGLIDDVPTCQELVDRFIAEAEEVCSGMSNFVAARSRL
jgi:nitronate monooxygenase